LVINRLRFKKNLQKYIATIIKLSVESEKDGTGPPLFDHIGDEISKNKGKKVHWASTGHETQFSTKFGAKLSLPSPFFS
jgi:hypothetical protein